MRFTADEVAQYLKEHPEFFDEYAEVLAEIYVPHPHGGRAIPIAERQIVTLRDRNRALEDKLHELVRFGQENDGTITKMHNLTLALIAADSLDAVAAALVVTLRTDFEVPHAAVRLWAEGEDGGVFGPASPEVRVFAASLKAPYFSSNAMFETAAWFGPEAGDLQSFAYVPVKGGACSGLVAMASADPARFRPDMGTLYLERMGDIASAVLARHAPAAG